MPDEPQRFVLGIAYQAGPDPRIAKGVDGGRDYFTKSELERACHSFMRSGPRMNAFHVDGTEDCAEPVESFIWRWPDWDAGDGIVVKDGDWLLGSILSPRMWALKEAGRVGGYSPQGTARRRRVAKEEAVPIAKGAGDLGADDDEMTQLTDADFPTVALVGKGANGIPRFLISKEDGSAGLLDAAYVRDLIAKADPEPEREAEQVTMTGSPAAIAAFIHKAAVRAGDDVAKAGMSSADINDLPDSAFGYVEPGGKKDASGKTTPRSKRHFPIHDKTHADNAAARIAQGAKFGDKAKGKVHAAQRKFGEKVSKESGVADVTKADIGPDLDEGVDGMDPTVPLAAPDEDKPGDPTDPGSPAWEAIDAATAQKWTSIAVRLKNALCVMADREMLEAASADPDDACNAFDLQDAMCAVDYVIDTLAGFAVDEQAEADLGGEAMEAIGKALAGFDPAPLEAMEGLAAIAKAGRVLSSANEAAIRSAAQSLQNVLASLPQAPVADEVTKEAAMAADQTPAEPAAVDAPETVAKAEDAAPEATEAAQPDGVAKADGDDGGKPPQVAVYDASGNLVGIADPADITPIKGADAPAEPAEDKPDEPPADAAPAADPADMTPQPPADAGTPADDVAKEDVNNGQDEHQVLKSIVSEAVAAALGAGPAKDDIAKQADVIAGLTAEVEVLKAQVVTLGEQPAMPKVFTNGAVPPPGTLRGQDAAPQGGQPVDVAKAAELKRTLYNGTAQEQNAAFGEMQQMAIDQLAAIHRR